MTVSVSPTLRLPYAFAKSQGVVLGGEADAGVEAFVHAGTLPTALAEARRAYGIRISAVRLLDAAAFERQLAEAYSHADQTAAEVADDIGQELDLSRLVQEPAGSRRY